MKKEPRVLLTITTDDLLALLAGATIGGIFFGWLWLDDLCRAVR